MNLELDLHGLTVDEAINKIQRTIVKNQTCTCIETIHGYRNGCVLKNVLMDKNNLHNKRVLKTLPHPFNEGRTIIYLKK